MRILIVALSLLIASSLATAGQAQQYGAPGYGAPSAAGYYPGYSYDPSYPYAYPAYGLGYGYPGYGYPYYYGPSIGVFWGGGHGGWGGGWHGGYSR